MTISTWTKEAKFKHACEVYRLGHVGVAHRKMRIFRHTEDGTQMLGFVLGPGELTGDPATWPKWMSLGSVDDFGAVREYGIKRHNFVYPRRHVVHRDLERLNDESAYKSVCPECGDGVLFVQRDQTELTLLRADMCAHCWCRFWYVDDAINGEKLHG